MPKPTRRKAFFIRASLTNRRQKKTEQNGTTVVEISRIQNAIVENSRKEKNGNSNGDPFASRQSISEVLHDIYDKK
jgi:hypothetical protein